MDIFLLLLRLVHILSGVLWVGGALMMNFFIVPTIGATAQAGKRLGHLSSNVKFPGHSRFDCVRTKNISSLRSARTIYR